MANFSELSGIKQWGVVILGGAVVTAALYFTVFKSQSEKNATAQHALEDKVRENNELESYRPKLKQIEQQLAELEAAARNRAAHRARRKAGRRVHRDDGRGSAAGRRGIAPLHRKDDEATAVLHRSSVRYGTGWSVLLDC